MRIRITLARVALLVTAGCSGAILAPPERSDSGGAGNQQPGAGGSGTNTGSPGNESGPPAVPDAASPPDSEVPLDAVANQPCPSSAYAATPIQACYVASSARYSASNYQCTSFCADMGAVGSFTCSLPADYWNAFLAAQTDGGSLVCPAWPQSVDIQCDCADGGVFEGGGRRTEGIADVEGGDVACLGELFARRAYLEAVSVHAFDRLERELLAHRAPASLRRDARKARRDENRHTAMTARLARRYGAKAQSPAAPAGLPVRSLFDMALENAVEGCVRETYGAVLNLVESKTSRDPAVRRAMRSIGVDECRHAELAWDVAAWAWPRLSRDERREITTAMRQAWKELANHGDPTIVRMLVRQLWREAGPRYPWYREDRLRDIM